MNTWKQNETKLWYCLTHDSRYRPPRDACDKAPAANNCDITEIAQCEECGDPEAKTDITEYQGTKRCLACHDAYVFIQNLNQ